jgi:hypothetical protein
MTALLALAALPQVAPPLQVALPPQMGARAEVAPATVMSQFLLPLPLTPCLQPQQPLLQQGQRHPLVEMVETKEVVEVAEAGNGDGADSWRELTLRDLLLP